ncbi:hypothetical protein ACFTWS_40130 [Streptomyces sp. NPDC057027]|uniref:hypothetical protein n=1 Tax=Streptomyces sp. NPDC057027 TaxID=3346004 RepID=UPI00363D1040
MLDDDTSSLHSTWEGEQLLFRADGYWWNGSTWYRPGQVWDPVEQEYEKRKARAAVTVSAADVLDRRTDPGRASLGKVADIDAGPGGGELGRPLGAVGRSPPGARRRAAAGQVRGRPRHPRADRRPADRRAGDGRARRHHRLHPAACISRGNSEVPQPQALVGGRDQWDRAVADDWVEARQRSYEGVRATMSAGDRDQLSRGAAEVRDRFADDFQGTLWGRPDVRKRWILRARNENSVREIADALAWNVASSLDRILPPHLLGHTVESAVLHDFADAIDLDRQV